MPTNLKKPKTLTRIENKLMELEEGTLRYKALESARVFKKSWIEFGQFLHTVYKEKEYKDWGYLSFEGYCREEIGIRKDTANKLVKSYYFLENHEPKYVSREYLDEGSPKHIPQVEAVNTLRQAKGSRYISNDDYEKLREDVLEKQKDPQEVKKAFRYILKSTKTEDAGTDPNQEKKKQFLKRMLGVIKGIEASDEMKPLFSKNFKMQMKAFKEACEKEIDA